MDPRDRYRLVVNVAGLWRCKWALMDVNHDQFSHFSAFRPRLLSVTLEVVVILSKSSLLSLSDPKSG